MLAVTRDGRATLSFPAADQAPATTCAGHLSITAAGVAITKLTCQGASKVATDSYATPVSPTLSGGCLSFSSDAHFETHPGACSSTTAPTVTFAPVTATT